MSTPSTTSWNQNGFQFLADDADPPKNATALAAINANISKAAGTTFACRILIKTINVATPGATSFGLMYSKNGGAYTAVTTTSSVIKAVQSSQAGIVDGEDTLQLIGSGTFMTLNGGVDETGSFTTGGVAALNDEIESHHFLQLVGADVVAGDTVDLRLYIGGSTAFTAQGSPTPGAYNQTPRITVLASTAGTKLPLLGVG